MDVKRKMTPADRLRVMGLVLAVLIVIAVIFALVLAVIVPVIQWQADVDACVRILGLDRAYCETYLRVIRE